MNEQENSKTENSDLEQNHEVPERVRAVDNKEKIYKFRNRIRYKKQSNLRRKFKKRYYKYKTTFIVSFLVVSVVLFLVIVFKSAWDTTKEFDKRNIELRIQKKINDAEKNKKF